MVLLINSRFDIESKDLMIKTMVLIIKTIVLIIKTRVLMQNHQNYSFNIKTIVLISKVWFWITAFKTMVLMHNYMKTTVVTSKYVTSLRIHSIAGSCHWWIVHRVARERVDDFVDLSWRQTLWKHSKPGFY